MEEPRYYGSWKGRVIEAIVDGTRDWKGLGEVTELSPKALNRAIAELRQIGILTQEKTGLYRVSPDIWKEYKAFHDSQEMHSEEMIVDVASKALKGIGKIFSAAKAIGKEKDIRSWIEDWKKVNSLDFPLDSSHFYLKGMYLDNISKGLIQRAKKEILVANPYINSCYLTNSIQEAGKNGIKTTIVTRPIRGDRYRDEMQEYHNELKQSGVALKYHDGVHAKLLVVDNEIAVISSMNLTVTSSGGSSWEAGVVSIDRARAETE